MCKSVPQIAAVVTLIRASEVSLIWGTGVSLRDMWKGLPSQVMASIVLGVIIVLGIFLCWCGSEMRSVVGSVGFVELYVEVGLT